MQSEEQQPPESPFAWIGGEEKVKALVERFYDLMELDPAFAELRAVHGASLASAREKLYLFLSGWLGIDLQTRGLASSRLLDAVVTFHDALPGPVRPREGVLL